MNRHIPFAARYSWKDFDNVRGLTTFQRRRIKLRFKKEIKFFIQEIINESVNDRAERRLELDDHNDPNNPFKLELGGEA
jgi:hypothetical protein|tara:strand:- start:170 stop:406 length:237 start_codon:yes stop_codon:yes gene_type:complete